MKRPVIFDTDPGVDDALALLFLAARPELELTAITTVFGNSDIATVTRNALHLRERFGLDAPVFQGAVQPLTRPRRPSPVHIHGANALGDIALPDLSGLAPDPGLAHEKIIDLARARPGELTLIAVGPLTNLALALDAEPELPGLIREVVVMGGALGVQGRRGNVTPDAEANFHNDPEAAERVLAAPWPVTLVGLDVTLDCVMTTAQAAALARTGDNGRFVEAVSRRYAAAYAEHDGIDGCCLHDVAAVAYAVRPDLFTTRHAPIAVTLDGVAAGRSDFGMDTDRPSQTACVDVDGRRLVELFLNSVRS